MRNVCNINLMYCGKDNKASGIDFDTRTYMMSFKPFETLNLDYGVYHFVTVSNLRILNSVEIRESFYLLPHHGSSQLSAYHFSLNQ